MNPKLFSCEQLSHSYPEVGTVLDQITFDLYKGEVLYLTGHSGAGKSTLLRLIALLEQADAGKLTFNQLSLGGLSKTQAALYRRQLGIISQDPKLLYEHSVFDNVALPLSLQGIAPEEFESRVKGALTRVGLRGRDHRLAKHLSLGEQQKVAIARAIVHKPKLVLADEPTANLDPTLAQSIFDLFMRFKQFEISLIVATHDVQLIEQFPSRTLCLNQGRLVHV